MLVSYLFPGLLIALAASRATHLVEAEEIDWVKYFGKLNKELAKKVPNLDLELILKTAEKKLVSENNRPFKSVNTIDAIQTFIEFHRRVRNGDCSSLTEALAFNCNFGIDDTNLDLNHELRPIDYFVQEIGLKFAKTCPKSKYINDLRFVFKQPAYLTIDRLVVDKSDHITPEHTMMAVEQALEEAQKKFPNGSLTDAMRQIVKLKSMASTQGCTDEANDILLRNNLATDFPRPNAKRGVIKRLVAHYTDIYLTNCRSQVLNTFKSSIQRIDGSDLAAVASIAAHFSTVDLGGRVDDLQLLHNKLTTEDNMRVLYMMSKIREPEPSIGISDRPKFRQIVRELAEGQDGKGFVEAIYSGEQLFDHQAMSQVFEEFLVQPCAKFRATLGSSFEPKIYTDLDTTMEGEDLSDWAEYIFLRPAYFVCGFLVGQGQLKDSAVRWLHPTSL